MMNFYYSQKGEKYPFPYTQTFTSHWKRNSFVTFIVVFTVIPYTENLPKMSKPSLEHTFSKLCKYSKGVYLLIGSNPVEYLKITQKE